MLQENAHLRGHYNREVVRNVEHYRQCKAEKPRALALQRV